MTVLGNILRAAAELLADVEERSRDIHEEADPRTTLELLSEYSEWLGIADDCTDGGPTTVQDERVAIVRKLAGLGGQNRFHYSELAKSIGYEIEIEDFQEHTAFIAEESEAEDELLEDDSAFWVEIHAPVVTPRFARAGETVAGEPLVDFGNDLLECVLDNVKPAHVFFSYVYDLPYSAGYAPWNLIVPDPLDASVEVPPLLVIQD